MRNSALFFLGALFIFLTGCSKDDGPSTSDLIGEWTLTAHEMEGFLALEEGDSTMTVELSGRAKDLNENNKIQFHEDNTFTSSSGSFTLEAKWKVLGQEITDTTTVSNFFGQGTWTKDKNTLTIDDGSDEPVNFHIETLNSSTLELTLDQTLEEMLDDSEDNLLQQAVDGENQIKLTLKK